MSDWRPKEIIVHETVRDDPVTTRLLNKCPGTPVKYVTRGIATKISEVVICLSTGTSCSYVRSLESFIPSTPLNGQST